MKKLLWIGLIVCLVSSAKGQCKYWVNEVDEFKGFQQTFTEFETMKGGSQEKYEASFGRAGSRYYVYIRKRVDRPEAMVVGYNDELIFKIADGTTINVKSDELTTGDINATYTTLLIKYQISREQLEKLSSSAITKFRIYASKGYWEEDVKESRAADLRKALSCILGS